VIYDRDPADNRNALCLF